MHILSTSSLSETGFANIFSLSITCFLILLKSRICSSPVYLFSLQKLCLTQSHKDCLLMFSFKISIVLVLHLVLRSILNSVCYSVIKYGSKCFFVRARGLRNVNIPFFQHHLLKRLSFLHWIFFALPLSQFAIYMWLCFWASLLFCSSTCLFLDTTLLWWLAI